MRRALFALGLVLGAVWATAAVAAPSPGEVGQAVNAGAASSVDVGQIAPRGGAAAVAAPDQISAPGGKAEAASLPASAPTDATSAPLVQGSDRCDPAAASTSCRPNRIARHVRRQFSPRRIDGEAARHFASRACGV